MTMQTYELYVPWDGENPADAEERAGNDIEAACIEEAQRRDSGEYRERIVIMARPVQKPGSRPAEFAPYVVTAMPDVIYRCREGTADDADEK